MKLFPLIILLLTLTACSSVPYDSAKLNPPAKWMMAKPCGLPKYPENDGDPVERAQYDLSVRQCASRRGSQVTGLQRYVKQIVKASND